MDMQLKKGLLDVLVLSTLLKEDSYGYRIIRDLAPVSEISESTLYPILKRLEAAKLLNVGAQRIYRALQSNKAEGKKIGRIWYFKYADILSALSEEG